MKKGFTIQFNWIFVLIAGALILAFFFSFALKQRSLSEEKLSVTLTSDLDSILVSSIVSTGTAQELLIPEVSFECSEGCDCRFRIGRSSRSFGDLPIFSTGFVKDKGIVWALDWKVPYRVSNFLYVTDASTKFFFVHKPKDPAGDKLLAKITERIPPLIDYEVIEDTDVTSLQNDYDSVRFVFLNLRASDYSLDDSFEDEFTSVSIDDSFIQFYVKPEDKTFFTMIHQAPYSGLELMFAGIFSYDDVMYECGVRSALAKLKHVSHIISERAKKLQDLAAAANRPCVYSQAVNALSTQNQIAEDIGRIDELDATVDLLDRANRDALQRSCPELF
ncbi:hypothetical protein KY329_05215 [Candidatus Woesearchaeota archaeon]|nr:hypothetical protein [Candidatus Woesearchaeota archaeon]